MGIALRWWTGGLSPHPSYSPSMRRQMWNSFVRELVYCFKYAITSAIC